MINPSTTLTVGALNNAGNILIGDNQVFNLNGNYTQTGKLTFGIASPSSFGKMVVSSNANVTGGQVVVAPGSVLAKGVKYSEFFKAGSVTGSFAPTGTYGLMGYKVVANGNGFDLIADGAAPGPTPSNTSMTPVLGGGAAAAMNNLTQSTVQVIRDRFNSIANKSSNPSDNVWATTYGNYGTQGANGGIASTAYNQKTAGVAFGVDAPINADLDVGVAGIVQNTNFSGKSSITQDSLSVASYQVTGYAKQDIGESSELRFIVNAATDQSSSKRIAVANGISETATAKYNGWHGLVSAEARTNIKSGQSTFSPLVRADYGYVATNAYTEKGAGGSNLTVGAQKDVSAIASTGLAYKYDITDKQSLSAKAVVGYDFASADGLTATDVNGISFTLPGNSPSSLITQSSLGYEYTAQNNIKTRVSYDRFTTGANYTNNMINLNIVIPFK